VSETEMAFTNLRERKRRVAALAEEQLQALQRFHYGEDLARLAQGRVTVKGFALNPLHHPADDTWHLSVSSTATCVRSLLASPRVGDKSDYGEIVAGLNDRYDAGDLSTRGLDHGNVYTLGQLLPTLRRMVAADDRPPLVDFALSRLTSAVEEDGVRLGSFPPNGYLTYWSLVALDSWAAFDAEAATASLDWSARELHRQLALFVANDDEADPYQLGYNLLIQRRFRGSAIKDSVVAAALGALFASQLPGGLWEKKEPLFTYGTHGDAYPFTFEMLNAVLREFVDGPEFLAAHEDGLESATAWAGRNAYGGSVPLWRSGHLADTAEPESWATAEIYFFLRNYHTYLADRVFVGVLRQTGRGRSARPPDAASFTNLYQPAVTLPPSGDRLLLGELLSDGMLEPLRLPAGDRQTYSLARHPRRSNLPRSGIFFGPPGTGKTTYAAAIAAYLGWPLLTVTPADFAAEGMLLIPTVGRRLFDRLIELEDTVIFFDEMEELIHKRGGDTGTFEQRFLTTSFLPALQDLRDRAACIYLVATNRFEDLDEAARAPRRFDFQLQIRPPAYEEKLRMLARDFPTADTAAVQQELAHSRDKLEWATLREARTLFRDIASAPADVRVTSDAFQPVLMSEESALNAEARNNFFAAAA
jgi:hypothetical protein